MQMNRCQELVKFHVTAVQGMYFNGITEEKNYIKLRSSLIEDAYYNFVTPLCDNYQLDIERLFEEYKGINRDLCLYIQRGEVDNFRIPEKFDKKLYASDSYMVFINNFPLKQYSAKKEIVIKKVESKDAEKYCNIFAQAYSSEDPADPYGKLPESYKVSLYNSFSYTPNGFKFEYYIAEYSGIPGAVVSTISNDNILGVYGLGTIPQLRKHGLGTTLMQYIVNNSIHGNNKSIILQTEQGSTVEAWYLKMGFESICVMDYYVIQTK